MIDAVTLIRHIGRCPELWKVRGVTPASYALTKSYLQIGGPVYPVEVPLRDGGVLTLRNKAEVQVFWQIFVRNCYWLPPDCKTIVDAGANVGLFSIWAARKAPAAAIWAIEPSPSTYASLLANIGNNRLEGAIRPFQLALGAEPGDRRMSTLGDSPNHALLPAGSSRVDGSVVVTCTTLVEFLEAHSIAQVDVLKMDIEGCEYEVLRAIPPADLRRIRCLMLEYHDYAHNSPQELLAYLQQSGFRVISLSEDACGTGLARLER